MSRAHTKQNDLVGVDTRAAKLRALLVLIALSVLICAFFAVRWQLGNMLSVLTPETDPYAGEIAKLATGWAPGDPAGFALAASASDPDTAAQQLEEAARRAPHDFRWRIQLARAYEQAERPADAERELRKAVELAPNFALPRWSLGNFLLRAERTPEAFSELKIAAEKNQFYRDEVFSLLWDYSNKNASRVEQLAGDTPELVTRLAYFFAARGQAADALRAWNRVPVDLRDAQSARAIALGLFEKQHFREALAFAQDYGAETTSVPGAVTNPSFEEPILSDETLFGWRVMRSDPKFEAAPDNRVKREGNRSLRATFKGQLKPNFANIYQTVVIEPGSRYRISGWVRTENLRTAGAPVLEVINPASGSRLGVSKPFPAGSSDWEAISVDFAVPAESTGITIRTVRLDCGEDCPITGIFWYDGFSLEKL